MKKLIILITFFFLAINIAVAEKTAKDLLNPSNNAYDFTFSSDINEDLNSYSTSQVVDKVEMDVEKILGFIPRTNVIFECQEDTYGSTYCPEALAPASDYLAYSESQVIEHKKTITDYEQGTYQELTSTVRDFMDGYAIENTDTVTDSQTGSGKKNVGTVIDYQSNSTATKHVGSVIDVTEKEGSSNAIEPNSQYVYVIRHHGLRWKSGSNIIYSGRVSYVNSYDSFDFGFLPIDILSKHKVLSVCVPEKDDSGTHCISNRAYYNYYDYRLFEGKAQKRHYGHRYNYLGSYYYSGYAPNGSRLETFDFGWLNIDFSELPTGRIETNMIYQQYCDEGGCQNPTKKAYNYKDVELNLEKNCPSGYIMNSDSTKCLKLENPNTTAICKFNVFNSDKEISTNSNTSVTINAYRYIDIFTDNNCAITYNYTGSSNGSSVKEDGTIGINKSILLAECVDGSESCMVNDTLYNNGIRNEYSCNQYGEMVNVGGTNYCTYEYTYDEAKGVLQTRKKQIGNRTSDTGWYDVSSTDGVAIDIESAYTGGDEGGGTTYTYIYLRFNNGVLQTRRKQMGNRTSDTGWYDVSSTDGVAVDIESAYTGGDEGGGTTYTYIYLRNNIYCNEGGELVTYDGRQMCRFAAQSAKCPDGYSENASGTCEKTVNYDMYSYSCPANYTPINNGFTSYQKTDPDPTLPNWNTLDDAVNSATAPAENCKRTITYEYYNYNCPNGYTVANPGLTMCDKTDPNKSTNDSATLSQPCNSSTPPQGNCTKEVAYNYYEYACSNGYTPIDAGLTECTKTDTNTSGDSTSTLDDACNSATPPSENCYKDISYKHYTYGCSEGYITDNYGLATCPKTDPNRSANNSELLDDACNSATPPEGNCRKDISYSYYEYLCEGQNSFYESYTVLDGGLSECEKTDSDINSVNSDLSTACNSSTAPKGNCESTEYTCNSNVFNPVFVDNKWQCSTYFCNDENKCGYGMCESYVSQDSYMPSSLNILSTVVNSDPVNCNQNYEYDNGISQKHIIKYCENGYIENATCLEKDTSNNCIKFETSDTQAKCIQDNNTCTDGYEKINGVCTAEPTKEYYFHTYTCKNETNQFNENWELINDVSDPGCIDDTFGSCINFDESTSNCRRLTRSCSNGGECTLDASANQWKCTNDYSYIENTSCNGPMCDLVLNDKITYCVNEECPTANGVYEVDGDCKIKLCPDGTFESDGLCYTE